MLDLDNLKNNIHKIAKEHGWWEEPKSFGELIALCHSELSEALEEYRNNKTTNEIYYSGKIEMSKFKGNRWETVYNEKITTSHSTPTYICKKPEGIPIELADTIIRILDICGYYNIDIEKAIAEKVEYNKTRPYKHGGKKI